MFINKILNRYKIARAYRNKQFDSIIYPVDILIEPTNVCNLKCIMCQNQRLKRKRGFMDVSLYKKIVDESRNYTDCIYLNFMGEPTLHPQIYDMIKYSASAGIKTILNTNASMMDKKMSKKLIESGLDAIKISLDGISPNTYEAIRIGGSFSKTVQNIIDLMNIKKEIKSNIPLTVLQLISMEKNENERDEFLKTFSNAGIDLVISIDKHNWGNDRFLNDNDIFQPCSGLWSSANIYWNGDVVSCCYDVDGRYVLGNVVHDSIKSIWNNTRTRELRKKHVMGLRNSIDLCKRCTAINTTMFSKPRYALVKSLYIAWLKWSIDRSERYSEKTAMLRYLQAYKMSFGL